MRLLEYESKEILAEIRKEVIDREKNESAKQHRC